MSSMCANNCVLLYDITLGFNIVLRPNLKYSYFFHVVGWQTEHREKMQRGNVKRRNMHPKVKEGPKGNDCLYFQGLVVVVVHFYNFGMLTTKWTEIHLKLMETDT